MKQLAETHLTFSSQVFLRSIYWILFGSQDFLKSGQKQTCVTVWSETFLRAQMFSNKTREEETFWISHIVWPSFHLGSDILTETSTNRTLPSQPDHLQFVGGSVSCGLACCCCCGGGSCSCSGCQCTAELSLVLLQCLRQSLQLALQQQLLQPALLLQLQDNIRLLLQQLITFLLDLAHATTNVCQCWYIWSSLRSTCSRRAVFTFSKAWSSISCSTVSSRSSFSAILARAAAACPTQSSCLTPG